MRKVITYIRIFIISTLFVSCSSYQLASYYIDNDGIYESNERGIDYEVVFKDYVDESLSANSSDTDSGNLPWGANPDSREVINNFFPSFGRFYLDPFSYNMGLNPFFSNNGSFINYGFRPPFFYNSFAHSLGYPFYGPMNFYFSPYATSLGNYYWYMMQYSRNYPWYSGVMNNSIANNQYRKEPSRVDFSNSASRRGEKNSTNNSSRKNDKQGLGVSGIYSRISSYGGIYVDRTGQDFGRIDNNLIGVYSKGNSNRNTNRNSSIPNLSSIKNDYVREAYRQVRSVNPNQRGNSFNYSSARARSYSSSPNQSQFNSSSNKTRSSSYSGPSRSSQGASYSSGRSGGSAGGSKGSASGSRGGGKIN